MTYELIATGSGNTLEGYATEQAARQALARILNDEPEARGHIILVEFDTNGYATRRIDQP